MPCYLLATQHEGKIVQCTAPGPEQCPKTKLKMHVSPHCWSKVIMERKKNTREKEV